MSPAPSAPDVADFDTQAPATKTISPATMSLFICLDLASIVRSAAPSTELGKGQGHAWRRQVRSLIPRPAGRGRGLQVDVDIDTRDVGDRD